MWVKICANTNLEDALLASELGADAIGFVFAPSKRQVNVEQVAAITSKLPAGIETIGVFTSGNAAEILAAAQAARLTGVQLHGHTDPALIETLRAAGGSNLRLVQVVGFERGKEAEFAAALEQALRHPGIDAVLLDTVKSGVSGGLGVTFDWSSAAQIVRRLYEQTRSQTKLIVAGGLHADNVAEAIAIFQPDGVDVASGTEASAGRKDPARVQAFLTAARSNP
ncbi:MAG: phosphoribosylanthranilate isomerase [Acidobacteriaceae bacterium]|nr:phosphoribosylanthranilate isomerase [Acidobacteriaceae bacterium]